MAKCTALACPRLRNTDPDDKSLSVNFSSTLATRDALGNTWCNYCIKQCELINWGKAHHWPEIHTTSQHGKYAIAVGQSEWVPSVFCSTQDAIDAYHACVMAMSEQSLTDIEDQARVARAQARRERWHARTAVEEITE